MKANSVLETIGNTPHIRINRLFGDKAEVWVKSERSNPGASIKDRIALSMVEDAERSGKLKPGGTIVEPTSGNTGIGLAMVAAVKGYKLTLVMPESMSIERRRLMAAYGANLELTPREKGMKGAIEKAHELVRDTPGAWMPMPRKDSELSASMTKAKSSVAMVTSVGSTTGRMWRNTIRRSDAPMTRAACTNMRSRISSTSARVVRR